VLHTVNLTQISAQYFCVRLNLFGFTFTTEPLPYTTAYDLADRVSALIGVQKEETVEHVELLIPAFKVIPSNQGGTVTNIILDIDMEGWSCRSWDHKSFLDRLHAEFLPMVLDNENVKRLCRAVVTELERAVACREIYKLPKSVSRLGDSMSYTTMFVVHADGSVRTWEE